jgi:hypothetical protein
MDKMAYESTEHLHASFIGGGESLLNHASNALKTVGSQEKKYDYFVKIHNKFFSVICHLTMYMNIILEEDHKNPTNLCDLGISFVLMVVYCACADISRAQSE